MLGRVPVCHSFPVSCKTTLLPPYLTSCGTSRPARFSMGSPTQPLWTAVGEATCTRSTHGWAGEASPGGLSVCETEDRREAVVRAGAKRSQESDKRPAAAARQRGAEMNETHGPCTSEGISQDIPGYASLRFLYLLIPRYFNLENLS